MARRQFAADSDASMFVGASYYEQQAAKDVVPPDLTTKPETQVLEIR